MNDARSKTIYFSAVLALLLLAVAGCTPKPTAAPEKLEVCSEGLRTVPAVFTQRSMTGMSAPMIDPDVAATAECIDATSTRHLAEIEARTTRAHYGYSWDLDHLLAGRANLAEAKTKLDETLARMYGAKVERSRRGIDLRPFAAVALFDYARSVREAVDGRLHTRVEALRDSPFCAGDIIESRMLWRYFEASLRARGGNRDAEAEAARELRAIAIQTACLGDQQLFDLDTALTTAWNELESRVSRPLLETIEPMVFQVRLIVFDATKHFGESAPGYQWLATREALRKKVRDAALYPLHEVLWFYDRRTAGLAAIKTQCRDGGSGARCLNVAVFTETLLRPPAYGMGECSFLEMVEGGIRNVGGAPSYTCTGGACGTPTRDGRIADTKLGGTFAAAMRAAGEGYALPGRKEKTPFGVSVDAVRGLLCGGKSGGGFGGRDGSAGMGAAGMGAAGATLACVIGNKAERTAALVPGMACIARYVQATSPLNANFEQMKAQAYGGVPRGCGIADDAKSEEETKKEEEKKTPEDKKKEEEAKKKADEETKKKEEENKKKVDEITKKVQEAAKKLANEIKNDPKKRQEIKDAAAKEGITVTDADIDKALDKLSKATAEYLVAKYNKVLAGATDLDGNIEIDIIGWEIGNSAAQRNTLMHEFIHSVVSGYWKDRWDKEINNQPGADPKLFKDVREATDTRIHNNSSKTDKKRCARDDSTCNDRCNGMARQTQQAVACLDKVLNPQTVPPTPDDLVTDPVEPEGIRGSHIAKCFEDAPEIAGTLAAKQCAAVRCANGNAGYTRNGCCQAGGLVQETGMGGRQSNICQVARCEASYAGNVGSSAQAGRQFDASDLSACGCGGSYAAPPGGGGISPPNELPFPPGR